MSQIIAKGNILPISDRHPEPRYDSKLLSQLKGRNWGYFGFGSLAQLKFWVYKYEWRETLHSFGYHVSVIQSKDAIIGDTQVVFWNGKRTGLKLDLTRI